MLKFVKPLLGAVALAASLPTFADTIVMSNFTFSPTAITVGAPNYSGAAGQFTGTRNGDPFLTFCTDLLQSFGFNTVYTDYSVVSGLTAWGAQKSQDMNKLMSLAIQTGQPASGATSAAFQAAVWEVIYETSGSYDFNAGTFTAISGDFATQTALNSLLWANVLSTSITHTVDKLYSPSAQDFLVIQKAPEPETFGLMGAALLGMSYMARRRHAQA